MTVRIIWTTCTGYFPIAVSPESITALVESKHAFATSDTSARVGIGFSIIDSIIWVAVITGFAVKIAFANNLFLGNGHVFDRHFDAHIATRYHTTIRRLDDLIDIFKPTHGLNLGNELNDRILALRERSPLHKPPHFLNIGCAAHKESAI